MNRAGVSRVAVALLALLVLLGLGYLIALYASLRSISFSIEAVMPRVADPLQVILGGRLPLSLYVRVRGGGPLQVTVKSLFAEVYLEGSRAGSVSRVEPFVLSPGEEKVIELQAMLDLAGLLSQFSRLLEAVRSGEIEVSISGSADVAASFLVLNVPLAYTNYVLLSEPKPLVKHVSWSAERAKDRDVVSYRVVVANQYRRSMVEGQLKVVVMEDIAWGFDREASTRDFYVALRPGEERELVGSFTVYSGPETRGFYIKVLWKEKELYEMPGSYPPRLRVEKSKPTLEVVDAYWLIGNVKTYVAKVGDLVEAVVVVRAVGSDFVGAVTLEIWKDRYMLPDSRYEASTQSISSREGGSTSLSLLFSPDEASGAALRGYYIKVIIGGEELYVMPSSYPPRLSVIEAPQPSGSLRIVDTYWLVNGARSTTARVGNRVVGVVVVEAVGGSVSGSVRLEVWKDKRALPDSMYTFATFSVSLRKGEWSTLEVIFSPDEASGIILRGYYLRLVFNGGEVWVMGESYPPRLKVED